MLFPTSLVGSMPQPEWLIDRQKLAQRCLNPRIQRTTVRVKERFFHHRLHGCSRGAGWARGNAPPRQLTGATADRIPRRGGQISPRKSVREIEGEIDGAMDMMTDELCAALAPAKRADGLACERRHKSGGSGGVGSIRSTVAREDEYASTTILMLA